MKSFRGMEILRENTRHVLCYSRFDLGDKFKIYSRNEHGAMVFNIAFDSPTKAHNYFDKLFV